MLEAIPRGWIDEVIVVDSGSRDATPVIARSHGARVVRAGESGYGAACLAGISALDERTEIVVFLDADHSDDPSELPLLVTPLIDGKADMTIGTRTRFAESRSALTGPQRWGNWLATRLIRARWGHEHTDLGPFRAIRRDALDRLGMADRDYGWTVEMQIKAIRAALRIQEVPVHYRIRIGRSKISGTVRGTILAGAKILYVVGKNAATW